MEKGLRIAMFGVSLALGACEPKVDIGAINNTARATMNEKCGGDLECQKMVLEAAAQAMHKQVTYVLAF